jgi:hypothetical protein
MPPEKLSRQARRAQDKQNKKDAKNPTPSQPRDAAPAQDRRLVEAALQQPSSITDQDIEDALLRPSKEKHMKLVLEWNAKGEAAVANMYGTTIDEVRWMIPSLGAYLDEKKSWPNDILIFKNGMGYELYESDAQIAHAFCHLDVETRLGIEVVRIEASSMQKYDSILRKAHFCIRPLVIPELNYPHNVGSPTIAAFPAWVAAAWEDIGRWKEDIKEWTEDLDEMNAALKEASERSRAILNHYLEPRNAAAKEDLEEGQAAAKEDIEEWEEDPGKWNEYLEKSNAAAREALEKSKATLNKDLEPRKAAAKEDIEKWEENPGKWREDLGKSNAAAKEAFEKWKAAVIRHKKKKVGLKDLQQKLDDKLYEMRLILIHLEITNNHLGHNQAWIREKP